MFGFDLLTKPLSVVRGVRHIGCNIMRIIFGLVIFAFILAFLGDTFIGRDKLRHFFGYAESGMMSQDVQTYVSRDMNEKLYKGLIND